MTENKVYMNPKDCLLDRNPHDNPHVIRIPIFCLQESTRHCHSDSYVCQVDSSFCVYFANKFQASVDKVCRGDP